MESISEINERNQLYAWSLRNRILCDRLALLQDVVEQLKARAKFVASTNLTTGKSNTQDLFDFENMRRATEAQATAKIELDLAEDWFQEIRQEMNELAKQITAERVKQRLKAGNPKPP